MITTAVILAAGLGSRLKGISGDKPKGFLVLGGQPMVEKSVCKLLQQGIENIIIGTGYLNEEYDRLAEKYPQITCVENKHYASTGSMYTLYNLKDHLKEDFLLLESDLIYEHRSLTLLLEEGRLDVVLASGKTNSNDEVYIEVDSRGYLKNMSKKKQDLKDIYGELVGITKVSYATFQDMCAYAELKFKEHLKIDYEEVLVGVASDHPVYIKKVEDLAWCEIDDERHLHRAVYEVYPIIERREKMKRVKRNILLNPGPATTTDTVKYAQIVPDICPREKEFGDVMKFISEEITCFAANTGEYVTVLFGGSGTAAIEAILSSVIKPKDYAIIINNGAYGQRMCQIADIYGLNYREFKSGNDEPLDIDLLKALIKNNPQQFSHLLVVHNETTTGLLNDIQVVGEICAENDICMTVDAMSSFGAVPVDMKKMNISYLAASSNKNLQGMAGVSFVIASKSSLESTRNIKKRNLYLNLYAQYEYFLKNYQMQFTPPVQVLYALKQAVLEAKAEGIENRYKRYCESWETLISGLEKLGLKIIVPKEHHSKIITSVVEPQGEGYNFDEMHAFLYQRGFTIYPGKVSDTDTFRIANIGDITAQDIKDFLKLLEQYLRSKDLVQL